MNIKLLDDGRMVISENQYGWTVINFYDATGKFLTKEVQTSGRTLVCADFAPNGRFAASFSFIDAPNNQLRAASGIFTPKREQVLALNDRLLPGYDENKLNDPNWWVGFLAKWFQLLPSQMHLAYASDGHLFAAEANAYKITRYNTQYKADLVITRAFKPKVVSEEAMLASLEPLHEMVLAAAAPDDPNTVNERVVAKAFEKAEIPKASPAILGLVPMDDGHLLVVRHHDPESGKTQADIFDAKGRFIGQCVLPPVVYNPLAFYFGYGVKLWFRHGKAYGIENRNGDDFMVRYNYKLK